MAMERLTWRSIDAPSFTGAGALMESGNNTLQQALSSAGGALKAANAQRQNKYTADVLLRAGQMTNPDEAARFLETIRNERPGLLTDGGLETLMGLRDAMYNTEGKRLQNTDLRNDIGFEEYTRGEQKNRNAAQLGAADALIQARLQADEGNMAGARDTLRGITNPYALEAADAALTSAQSDYEKQSSRVMKDYNDSRTVKSDQVNDFARDYVQESIFPQGVASAEDAKNLIRQDTSLTPQQRLAAYDAVDKQYGQQSSARDPFASQFDVFSAIPSLGGSQAKASLDADYTRSTTEITNRQHNNPLYRLETTKQSLGDFGLDPKAKLKETLGLDDEAYSQNEIDNSIDKILARVQQQLPNVTQEDVVAAVASQYATDKWGMPWISSRKRGDRRVDEAAAIELLMQARGRGADTLYQEMAENQSVLDNLQNTRTQRMALEQAITQMGDSPRAAELKEKAASAALAEMMLTEESGSRWRK